MRALAEAGEAEIVAFTDPDAACVAQARALAPRAAVCDDIDTLLECELDGLVIATPNALHKGQAIAALQAGVAVFCQKPLALTAAQTRAVIACAREHDRLLGVDLSYRYLHGAQRIKQLINEGALGEIYALRLAFHNAFGPDKPWFYQRELSGGGCILDLGVHLIDLALWMFDYPAIERIAGRCYAGGQLLAAGDGRTSGSPTRGSPISDRQIDDRQIDDLPVEDYASLQLVLASGATVDIGCSWHLPLGRAAAIQAAFYGTRGGAGIDNVAGSFFDFRSARYDGCTSEVLYEPGQEGAWQTRAIRRWARQLAAGGRFTREAQGAVAVAEAIDAVYTGGRGVGG